MIRTKSALLFVVAAGAFACGRQVVEFGLDAGDDAGGVAGDDGTTAVGTDATNDARGDGGAGTGGDATVGADTGASSGGEGGVDTGLLADAVPDAVLDSSSDVRVDRSLDANVDTSVDVNVDAGDAAVDVTVDVNVDANLDASVDVNLDASLDASLDANLDASGDADANPCSQAPVVLASAGNFVVLAGSTVTSTGPTMITGDMGVSPGTAITGFPPGTIVGTQHAGDPTAAIAIADLTVAYNDAKGRTLCPVSVAGNIGGQTLTPNLYKSTGSLAVSSGDLTLDGQGDPNAVFIFQIATTLTTTPGRQVILIGSAKSTNVYWQVGSSATIDTTSVFQGTIMADQSITLNTGATLNGRALARIAAVALDSNAIVKPAP